MSLFIVAEVLVVLLGMHTLELGLLYQVLLFRTFTTTYSLKFTNSDFFRVRVQSVQSVHTVAPSSTREVL